MQLRIINHNKLAVTISVRKSWSFNMQTNPCYGDHTIPVYEELQLQDKAPEPTDVRVKGFQVALLIRQ